MKKKTSSGGASNQGNADAKIPAVEDTLLQDIQRMRTKRKGATEAEAKKSSISPLKNAIETILLWDFFLVIALLVWLAVALVPHFASKNDFLLDPWLALWQPFIQPVLGVLMLGTIVQGTLSYISKK
ncbi:hypothetical protein BWQ96_06421 [Gracilariopsis chorda]|uniref:Uncharacterized protein n=1 Tax=Gracilariopsis chorda TaxID=448386 RepID=A0A2V3IRM2_9FLOR|nr:hypothetical protein BWQ96_06421 [Gracilariopsis chorda]|eukprot:PXF43800.1 hypothetical protein BWQ96_06421 [Gracilariopsis chorda]